MSLCLFCCFSCVQIKLDEAQIRQQGLLQTKLKSEHEMLVSFQKKQMSNLLQQHEKERQELNSKFRSRTEELEKKVSFSVVCLVSFAAWIRGCCDVCVAWPQWARQQTRRIIRSNSQVGHSSVVDQM